MSARLPKTKTRAWVSLHTTMLTDPDLLLAGDAARLTAPMLLLWCAQQGTDGVLPADPRRVNVIVRLDGGVEAVGAALAALVEIDFLVDGDEPGTLRIRNWRRFQADFGGSATRAETMRVTKLKQAHEAGKHAEPREGCQLCADGVPSVAAPALTLVEPVTEVPKKAGTRELLADFRAAFPEVFAACGSRLDGYRHLLTAARDLADANDGLSPNLRSSLMNAVLADALAHYLELPPEQLARAYRGAKALSEDDGAYWWILAAQDAAGRELEQSKVLSYVQKVAASKRSEWLSGGAA